MEEEKSAAVTFIGTLIPNFSNLGRIENYVIMIADGIMMPRTKHEMETTESKMK